jgi:DNA-binding NarL/FixJ family response regulator
MTATPIRIIVVDDNPLYRETICKILGKQPDLQVVAEVRDGLYAIDAVKKHRPEIVLMDIVMPFLNGIKATHFIRLNFPGTKVIVLSMYSTQRFSDNALQAGACHFLTKDCSKAELLQAIRESSPGPLRVAAQPAH